MIIEKMKTGLWFLRRPSFWLHSAALAGRKVTNAARHERARSAAARWAEERAVTSKEALTRLGLYNAAQGTFPFVPQALLDEAQRRAEGAPVKMGGPGDLELLNASVLLAKPERLLETGVAYGWSSLVILNALEQNGAGRLASVDMPYVKANNEPYVGIVVPQELRGRWKLFRQPDRNGIRKALDWLGGAVDLCHYDSDKSYAGRLYAYPILWNALRPGGLLISDDIQDNFGFRDFCAARGIVPQVTRSAGKFIGLARKGM